MPELPEVRTVAKVLKKNLLNKKLIPYNNIINGHIRIKKHIYKNIKKLL